MNKRLYFIAGMITGAIILYLFIAQSLLDCPDLMPAGDEDNTEKIISFPGEKSA